MSIARPNTLVSIFKEGIQNCSCNNELREALSIFYYSLYLKPYDNNLKKVFRDSAIYYDSNIETKYYNVNLRRKYFLNLLESQNEKTIGLSNSIVPIGKMQ